jgi:hypothetical protein
MKSIVIVNYDNAFGVSPLSHTSVTKYVLVMQRMSRPFIQRLIARIHEFIAATKTDRRTEMKNHIELASDG